jgi:hypothetical protein
MRASYITPGITIFCGIGPRRGRGWTGAASEVKHVKKNTLYITFGKPPPPDQFMKPGIMSEVLGRPHTGLI